MTGTKLTPAEIEERFEEAALTLKRMPNPPGSGPSGYGSSWPAYVQEARHAYGYHEAPMRVVPNAAEIQRMDEALDWLRLIDHPEPGRAAIDRRIVWMRADGHRWRTVCRAVGLGRSQAWRRWSAALILLSRALGKAQRRRVDRAQKAGRLGGGDAGSVAREGPVTLAQLYRALEKARHGRSGHRISPNAPGGDAVA